MDHALSPRPATRILDGVLSVARWVLVAATGIWLVLAVIVVLGVGSATVAGSTEEVQPVRVEPGQYEVLVDGSPVDVAETTSFESDDGIVVHGTTDVTIRLGDDALVPRVAAVALVLLWLAVAWVVVINLHAVVRSTLEDDAFTHSNARRLRRVGVAALAYPAISYVGQSFIGYSVGNLDLAGPAVVADLSLAGWWVWVIAGLFFLVVADVYAHGVDLRELTDATV